MKFSGFLLVFSMFSVYGATSSHMEPIVDGPGSHIGSDRMAISRRTTGGGISPGHRLLLDGIPVDESQAANVLSIDGGGVRGIVPALFLKELEERCGPISNLFDLMVGTSTGGILATGLAAPHARTPSSPRYSAEDMLSLYGGLGEKIFKISMLGRVASYISTSTYDPINLEGILNEKLGETLLSQSRTPLVITSVDAQHHKLHLFRSYRALWDPTHEDFRMKDVARATSAAPTYFPIAEIQVAHRDKAKEKKGPVHRFVDGGMAANNPAMIAISEAHALFGKRPINLISLSTGDSYDPYKWEDRVYLARADPTISMLFNSSSNTTDQILTDLSRSRELGITYFRFKVPLSEELMKMDDPKTAGRLQAAAHEEIEKLKKLRRATDTVLEFDRIVGLLKAAKPS